MDSEKLFCSPDCASTGAPLKNPRPMLLELMPCRMIYSSGIKSASRNTHTLVAVCCRRFISLIARKSDIATITNITMLTTVLVFAAARFFSSFEVEYSRSARRLILHDERIFARCTRGETRHSVCTTAHPSGKGAEPGGQSRVLQNAKGGV